MRIIMKKLFLALIMCIVSTALFAADGDVVLYDQVYYIIGGDTATVAKQTDYWTPTGDIVIHEEIEDEEGNVYTVTALASSALYGGSHANTITSLYVPSTIRTWPNSVTGVFAYCDSLRTATFGKELTRVGRAAFLNDKLIKEIDLSDTKVENLGQQAFSSCTSMESFALPRTIVSIEQSNFTGDTSITSFTCLAETPPTIGGDTSTPFSAFSANCTLYIPIGCTEAYLSDTKWTHFKEIVEIEVPVEPFTCTVDPESGTTHETLSEITFSNEYGIYWNEDKENGYEGDPVTYTSPSGEVVEMENLSAIYDKVDPDKEISQIVMFEESPMNEKGEYTVVVPASFFYAYDEYGNKTYNDAMTLTYTITADLGDQEPNYELVFYPEDGSTLDILSTISISCEDGITRVLMPDEEITIVDSEGNNYGYSVLEVADDTGFVTEVDITLTTEIVDAGTYYVNVPVGYFDIGSQTNNAFTLTYTITGTLTGISGISINDENVEGIYSIGGQKIGTPQKGVNIIRCNDGTTKKVLIK